MAAFKLLGDYLYAWENGQLWFLLPGEDPYSASWFPVTATGPRGAVHPIPFVVFNGKVYGVYKDSNTGLFEIWRAAGPGQGTMAWELVVPNSFEDSQNNKGVDVMIVFNNRIYAGTSTLNGIFGNPAAYGAGVEIWQSDSGDAGSWSQVNVDGFGTLNPGCVSGFCNFPIHHMIGSAAVYQGPGQVQPYLYIGTKSHFGAELWRYDGSGPGGWRNVTPPWAGPCREDAPFGSRRFESLAVFRGKLYLAEGFPSGSLSKYDGANWTIVVDGPNPFDPQNQGLKSLAVLDDQLYVSTLHSLAGTEGDQVWRYSTAGSFEPTGSMMVERQGHSATLLPDGKVLVSGGAKDNSASAELYDPRTGKWAPTGLMQTNRTYHTGTLLQNGKVLVAGGYADDHNGFIRVVSSAELYDPATATWAWTAPMTTNRAAHTATLLSSGKVLVTGGISGSHNLADAELYDPVTERWTPTSPMSTNRFLHTATLLAGGDVLVAGGGGFDFPVAVEIYNPTTESWTATGPMSTTGNYLAMGHTATLLPGGQVLAAGGLSAHLGDSQTAQLYDAAASSWGLTAGMRYTRYQPTATLLPRGQVLVVGGAEGYTAGPDAADFPEMYDPLNRSWSIAAPPTTPRLWGHTATLLANGQVLIAGGNSRTSLSPAPVSAAELYDSGEDSWSGAGRTSNARRGHTATLVLASTQRLLVAGGYDGTAYLSSADLCNPASGTWTATTPLANARAYHTATSLSDGKVLAAGGIGSGGPLASTELYNTSNGTWTAAAPLNTARHHHTATLLPSGRVLVAGGHGSSGCLADAEVYNPVTAVWAGALPMKIAREFHTATLLPNGKVLVVGGQNGSGYYEFGAELYNPNTGTWMVTHPMTTPRAYHTATLLPNGKVLVAGGYNGTGSGSLYSTELYDPDTQTWTRTGDLNTARDSHTATLLRNGRVLVAGAYSYYGGGFLWNTEVYEPATGSWMPTASLSAGRDQHTATLLPDGKVLVVGGEGNNGVVATAEWYDVGLGFDGGWRPRISSVSPKALVSGNSLTLTGTGFRGISEASGGNSSQDSPTDYPVVQLRSLESGQTRYLLPDPAANWSATSFTSVPVMNFPIGAALITVFVNGIPSSSASLLVVKPTATLTLGNLNRTYDGTPKSVSVNTTPPGLLVHVTYNGAANPPVVAGIYTVRAIIDDAVYQGNATATLVITKAPATVTLANLLQYCDGTAKPVSVETQPLGLPVSVTYNGSVDAPTNVGVYAVVATITDPNRQGSATGTLIIDLAGALVDAAFNPDASAGEICAAVAQPDGKILLAGDFTTVGGTARSRIARVNPDGTLDIAFNPAADYSVFNVAVQTDGKILLGGSFTTINGTPRNYAARLNADGTLDTGFNPGADQVVYCVTVQADGKILLGGSFRNLNGTARSYIGRLNADGSLDSSFDPNIDGRVMSVVVQSDGKILLGGPFATVDGTARNRVARLNAEGSLDPGFNPIANGWVNALALQEDGKILVGGYNLTSVGGTERSHIVRLNADGSLDPGFNPNANNEIYTLALQTNGKILLGGEFITVGGTERNHIARLNPDGSLDQGFNPNSSHFVNTIALQANGQILVGGGFSTLGGLARKGIARLLNGPATQTLTIMDRTQVQWLRGGTAPELEQVAFEVSTDSGSTWTTLGEGMRINGGWGKTGLSLPPSGSIRARGRATAGLFNGSSSLIEQVAAYSLVPILINPGYLQNQPFQCTVIGQPGTLCVVEAATSLVDGVWVPLQTNSAPFTFIDTNTGSFSQRFYRAVTR